MTTPTSSNYSNKVNALSIAPVVGQAIGLSTVLINIAKIGYDCLVLANAGARTKKVDFRPDQPVAKYPIKALVNRRVTYLNQKEKLKTHLTYVGIGLIRMIPLFGGWALYSTKTAPRVTRIWNTDNRGHLVQQTKTQQKSKVLHAILAIPVTGQLVGLTLIVYHTSRIGLHALGILAVGATILLGTGFSLMINPIIAMRRFFLQTREEYIPVWLINPEQEFQAFFFNRCIDIREASVSLSCAIVATCLPIIGGATLYAGGSHRPPPLFRWKNGYPGIQKTYQKIEG